MTLSGCVRAVAGPGVTSATAAAAPAMWPAYGPTVDSARSRSRSSTTMNAQRCWFLELWARRPGVEDPLEVRGVERAAVERADRALGVDRVADVHGVPVAAGVGGVPAPARRSPSTADPGPGRPELAPAEHAGQRPEAAGLLVERGEPLRVGEALGGHRRRDRGRLVGRERAAEVRREEPRDRRAVLRELVQPRVPAALDEQRLGHGARAGPRGGRAASRVQVRRSGRRRRRCRGRAGPGRSIVADRAGRADGRDRVAARPEVDAGRQPGERPGDRRRGSAGGRGGTSGG